MSPSNNHHFISSVVILLLVLDPFGNIAAVIALLKDVNPKRRKLFIFREGCIATALLFLFMFFGDGFLSLINLSKHAMQISGGILLFIISLDLVFPKMSSQQEFDKLSQSDPLYNEPFIFPVAVPLLAGPSALATVMLLSNHSSPLIDSAALITSMAITTLILFASEWIYERIGPQTMNAIVRLMGLLLSTISVQMVLAGIQEFVHAL
ncbi:MarC family protein [Candidatus Ichthyocystis hellenicum]|uniref:MarC family protein n=1 Tax=Candidatus Ichthyocystis hellenicum TaxID=1561003 RepID=UPI000B82C35B|nr:MarC family protein [Candidatus Ichthyocystis hellenicum]